MKVSLNRKKEIGAVGSPKDLFPSKSGAGYWLGPQVPPHGLLHMDTRVGWVGLPHSMVADLKTSIPGEPRRHDIAFDELASETRQHHVCDILFHKAVTVPHPCSGRNTFYLLMRSERFWKATWN